MDYLQIIILSLAQGVTEFLPISSSAHLILISELSGWRDQGVVFDIAVHLGTLAAVLFHYRTALSKTRRYDLQFARAGVLKLLTLGSLPLFLTAYFFSDVVADYLRQSSVIAIATIGFALLLWYADRRHNAVERSLNWDAALWVGIAQAFALIPGTSRAGVTLTAALLLGFTRVQAVHIAFLLAIPAIAGSSFYLGMDLARLPDLNILPDLMLGFAISAGVALLTLRGFLKLVELIGLLPFVIYRLILGGVLLLFYT